MPSNPDFCVVCQPNRIVAHSIVGRKQGFGKSRLCVVTQITTVSRIPFFQAFCNFTLFCRLTIVHHTHREMNNRL